MTSVFLKVYFQFNPIVLVTTKVHTSLQNGHINLTLSSTTTTSSSLVYAKMFLHIVCSTFIAKEHVGFFLRFCTV